MELKLNLASINIAISFIGKAQKAIPLCSQYFRDFLCPHLSSDAEITVSVLETENLHFPFQATTGNPVFEKLLSTPDVASWLRELKGHKEDFPLNERTISSFCLGGLLLFDPDTASGRIYLLDPGPECFKPLYRLFWMYFAQVFGELGGCFIHAAALVKGQKGYLFMGDSGAGKSTLASLCKEHTVFSDDSPIFRKQDGGCYVFPSPYHQFDPFKGVDKTVTAMRAEVKGLYFLIQDNQVYLEKVSKKKAIAMIINRYIHFFLYLSTQARSGMFRIICEACDKLPTYNFHFRQDRNMWSAIIGK
ncbi:MAG: hypothetical protein JRJ14_03770 [Deltaproteobacteria bacterium]|nr:hypothetical protein [Deltaproteobacteria bacterium]